MPAWVDRLAHVSFGAALWLAVQKHAFRPPGLPIVPASAGALERFMVIMTGIRDVLVFYALPLAVALIYSRIPDLIDRAEGPDHRSFAHSLLGLLVLSVLPYLALVHLYPALSGIAGLLMLAAVVGHGSHIILDSLTYEGVPLLWPLDGNFGPRFCSAGGWVMGFVALVSLAYIFSQLPSILPA
ncbi:MAG: metal-dependent hydrolase [Nitrososphaerota archaeon]